MRYSGIQPQYFPRLHYFARILNTDNFVIRDDAQFVAKHKYPNGKNGYSYQSHSPIKQAFGTDYLKVPIKHDGRNPIHLTNIAYEIDWTTAHKKTLQTAYGKAKKFPTIYSEIDSLLTTKYQSLSDLNTATICWGILHALEEKEITQEKLTIEYCMKRLADSTFRLRKITKGSTVKAFSDGTVADRNLKIVEAIKEVGANEDYCGETAVDAYMDHELFQKKGINIVVQQWKCNEYPQLFNKQGFIPNLSIIDLLMNLGDNDAAKILRGEDRL